MRAALGDLTAALRRNELVPCFQPIVEMRTGKLAGFEVLARWLHPSDGLILPENFILLAEQNGLADELMEQVVSKAFKSAPLLPAPLMLAINVSPVQLGDRTLPLRIRGMAQEAGFPMERLVIEITESALVDSLESAYAITRELKAMGCKIAMDDFGTGYSSLRHLQALPFDKLKIDRSFVASMNAERESRKIVAAIVGLGQSLGLVTVAEGVETEEQAAMLQLLGCEMGQGWLYGKPLPAESIPRVIAAASGELSCRFMTPWTDGADSFLDALPAQRLAQLQAIYDGAPVGLCYLDRDLRHVSINRHLCEMNGQNAAAQIGKTVQETIPELYFQVEPYLARALQGESVAGVEASGPNDRTMLLSYQPAFDEAHEVVGVSVCAIDITERKRAENALRDSEDELRHMVELSPHIPWILDAEGNLLDLSSKWGDLTGLRKDETLKWSWIDAMHPDDIEGAVKAVREAIMSGNPIDVNHRIRTKEGYWKWMRSRGSPRYGKMGKVIRWYGILEDIDEQVQREETLCTLTHNQRASQSYKDRRAIAAGHLTHSLTQPQVRCFLSRHMGHRPLRGGSSN